LATVSTPAPPFVLAQDGDRFLRLGAPLEVLEAREPGAVRAVLERADAALAAGRWVAGFLSYEAAAAFGLATRPPDPDGPPLAWLGVFESAPEGDPPRAELGSPAPAVRWEPALDAAAHARALARIHEHLAAGDTYQVNHVPPRAPLAEEPLALFARLLAVQRPRYAALVDLGRFAIACASPELFFRMEDGVLTTRPMKGTAPRGLTPGEDEGRAAALRDSEKERAENLMIVDMLRNDLGRVAEVGSVEVPALFEVERYPTLLQMTSTVTARSRAPLSAVMAALFPCASVTGAPKRRTMEIVAATEAGPRGVYAGAAGWAGPDGRASFGVAIRTVVADRERGLATFGVGSGVVADSLAAAEYAECLLKARVLEEAPFALVETMAFLPGEGYRRLEGHLARLSQSARHFGFPLDMRRVEAALRAVVDGGVAVRALLCTRRPGRAAGPRPRRPSGCVGLAARPVISERVAAPQDDAAEAYDDAVVRGLTVTTCCLERPGAHGVEHRERDRRGRGPPAHPPSGLRSAARGRAGAGDRGGPRARGRRPPRRPPARAADLAAELAARDPRGSPGRLSRPPRPRGYTRGIG
jgi:para-aminobenzoate synthetase/4-amino-4-deoxychorismate lyase